MFLGSRCRLLQCGVVWLLAAAGACRSEPPSLEERMFREQVVTLVAASARHDTARVKSLVLDDQAPTDLALLRSNHPQVYEQPEKRFGNPYSATVKGDTGVAFFHVRGFSRLEFATEFRRRGNRWLIVRLGFNGM